MRPILALALLIPLAAGCTPRIPVKDDFGTSSLIAKTEVPPEFAEFNSYDPTVNALLSDQMCATPYVQLEEKTLGADPGQMPAWRGRCETHVPLLGSWPSSWPQIR
jgi:hypothetical protein